jgi:hypothetical protein
VSDKPSCGTCRFLSVWDRGEHKENVIICRRYPPGVINQYGSGNQPRVDPDVDWCGEWQRVHLTPKAEGSK